MSTDGFRSARDVDPLEDFDPIGHFGSDTWIRSEVTRVWGEVIGDTRPIGEANLDELGQDHFISLVLSLESWLHRPILARMHLFQGRTVEEFIQFLTDLDDTERNDTRQTT